MGRFQTGPFEFKINEESIENVEENVKVELRNVYRKIKGLNLIELPSNSTSKLTKKENESNLTFLIFISIFFGVISFLFYYFTKNKK